MNRNKIYYRLRDVALAASVLFASPAKAIVWDLADDWSDTNNPNGAWSYNDGLTDDGRIDVSSIHWDEWGTGDYAFPAWAARRDPEKGHVPVFFKAPWDIPGGDMPAGRVYMHTTSGSSSFQPYPANISWTSPIQGEIYISGGVWYPLLGLDRAMDWRLLINGVEVTGGNVSKSNPYSSADPFGFSEGYGGQTVLIQNVEVGDTVIIEIEKTTEWAYFLGVDMTIKTADEIATVPELPNGILLAALPVWLALLLFGPKYKSAPSVVNHA